MHSTSNLDDNYLGSGIQLWRSIRKHGKTSHIKEILDFLPNRKELAIRETEVVNETLLSDPLCMNLISGGYGGSRSNSNQQRKFIMAGAHAPGRIKKSSDKIKWLYENDPDWSNNTRSKISKGLKANTEWLKTWQGKKHKLETKNKIGRANSIAGKGSLNSQYGTMWITNHLENKKVKSTSEIPEGWERGRIHK